LTTFDRATLDLIDRALEVDIETVRPDGMFRRATIWPIVDGGEVFVRSWRGDRGYWYQAAREDPDHVSLVVGNRSIPVRVISAVDNESINRCSRGFQQKYADDPATPQMVSAAVTGTTLRIEPR